MLTLASSTHSKIELVPLLEKVHELLVILGHLAPPGGQQPGARSLS